MNKVIANKDYFALGIYFLNQSGFSVRDLAKMLDNQLSYSQINKYSLYARRFLNQLWVYQPEDLIKIGVRRQKPLKMAGLSVKNEIINAQNQENDPEIKENTVKLLTHSLKTSIVNALNSQNETINTEKKIKTPVRLVKTSILNAPEPQDNGKEGMSINKQTQYITLNISEPLENPSSVKEKEVSFNG